MNVVIMIPSLNPDQKLVNYVSSLSVADFRHIVVINDGSSSEYDRFFDEVARFENCTVLRHERNRGKGRALKTGMNYVLEHFPDCVGVVTADSDGQHKLEDARAVAQALVANDSRLVLGSRNFKSKNIPARSSFGNNITSVVFAIMFGQRLMDTQTGLRGIPLRIIPTLLNIGGEQFEYEMNMLIECRRRHIPIFEIPIETVYIEDNKSSHFRPVVDSFKIYLLIFREFISFILASLSCTLLDLCIYAILIKLILPAELGARIIIATVIARVISSNVNFFTNKNLVFHKKGHTMASAAGYFSLVVIQMLVSASLVTLLFHLLGWDEVLIKAIVDTALFFINFFIQKKLIFKTVSSK